MAVATTHTQVSLEAYAARLLGPLAAVLGITSNTDVVNEALLEYGVTDATEISGVAETKLILACVAYRQWEYVTQITNGKFDLTDSGTDLSLSQINEQARASAKYALELVSRYRDELAAAAAEADGVGAIRIYTVTRDDDEQDILDALEAAE